MRVLITGGAGFIGSTVAGALLDRGDHVVVLDSLASGERGRGNLAVLADRGAETHVGDIRDARAVTSALAGVEAVVHLAAMASVAESMADPARCHSINAEGTRLVLQAATERGVRRVVFASTAAVYGMRPGLPSREDDPLAPASPYAEAKIAGEEALSALARSGAMEPVIFRFFNVYGPGQDPSSSYSGVITRWVDALLADRPVLVFGDGSQTRDFIHVNDVARAVLAGLDADRPPALPMNVGSGTGTSLLKLLELLSAAVGKEPRARHEAAREGDVLHSRADISRVRDSLGFVPAGDLGAGLRELLQR